MGTLQPDSDEKGEMDDSGCVQDVSPPVKKQAVEVMDTNDAMENDCQRLAQLLDLSDDVLLCILKNCTPRDLKALGYTCTRLGALVRDRTLWQSVDARQQPSGRARLRWLLTNVLNDATTELLLCGFAREARGCLGHVTRAQCESEDGRGDADNNNEQPSTSRAATAGTSVENAPSQVPSAEGSTIDLVVERTPPEGAPVNNITADNAPQGGAPVDNVTAENDQANGASLENPPEEKVPVEIAPPEIAPQDAALPVLRAENAPMEVARCCCRKIASLDAAPTKNASVALAGGVPAVLAEDAPAALAEGAPPALAEDTRSENVPMEVAPPGIASLDPAPIENASVALAGGVPAVLTEGAPAALADGAPPALAEDMRSENVPMEVAPPGIASLDPAPIENASVALAGGVPAVLAEGAPAALAEGAPPALAEDMRAENAPVEVAPPLDAVPAGNAPVPVPGGALAALAHCADAARLHRFAAAFGGGAGAAGGAHRNGRAEPPYPLARQHARLHMSAAQQLPRFSGAPNWSDDAEPPHAHAAAAHVHTDSACAGPQFTLTQPMLKELQEHCTKLTSLSLEYCNINCKKTGINHLPPTLKKLSLRGTKCYNLPLDKSFLFKIHEHLPALEYLDVSESEWMEPASLLPLSKAPLLLTLVMRDCARMTEFVAYASLATRYGFRKLKVLDMRGSPVGDSEVSAFGWVPELEELYLAPISGPDEPIAEHSHFKGDALPPHNELEPWEIEEEPMYLMLNDAESGDNSLEDLEEQEEYMSNGSQQGSDFNICNEGVRIEVSLRATNDQIRQMEQYSIRRQARELFHNQGDPGPGPSKRKTSEERTGEKKAKPDTEDVKMSDDTKDDDGNMSGDAEMADAKTTEDEKAPDSRDVEMADDAKAADTSGDKSKRKGKRKTASPNKIDKSDGKSKRKRNDDVNQGASTSRASTSSTIDIRLEFRREPVHDSDRNPDENPNESSSNNGDRKSDSDNSDDDDDSPKKRKVAARASCNETEPHGQSIEVKVEVSQGREIHEQDGQGEAQNRQDQAENDQNQDQNDLVPGQDDQVQGQNDQGQGQNDQVQGENEQGDGQNDQVNVQARERRGSHERRGRRGHSRRRRFENIVRFRQDQDPVIIQCPILPQRQEAEQPENQEGEPRHHILYVNVGQQLHAVYRLLPSRPIFHSMRNRNWRPNLRNVFYSPAQPHVHSASLVTDSAIRRFGRADGDQINYVNIGPNGPYPAARDAAGRPVGLLGARDLGARPDRSSLRVLSVTGYRHITDRSLVHLATSAPHLRHIDFSNTGVTEQGVENFRSLRPDCEVTFSPFVEKNDSERTE